jgi:hypothetical protein
MFSRVERGDVQVSMVNAEHVEGHEGGEDVNYILVGAARVNASCRFKLVDKGTVGNGNFNFFIFK